MFKKKVFLPLLVILALALTACTTDDGETNPDTDTTAPVEDQDQTTENEETSEDEEIPADQDKTTEDEEATDLSSDEDTAIKIKPEEAFDIYMGKYPNTKVKKFELDTDYGLYVYEIKGYDNEKRYELKIDTTNGDLVKEDIDLDNDNDKQGEITRVDVEKVQAMVDKTLKGMA